MTNNYPTTSFSNKALADVLHIIINQGECRLQRFVANEALAYAGGTECFFTDLIQSDGWETMPKDLTHSRYPDEFFESFYTEINTCVSNHQQEWHEGVGVKHDIKHDVGWFAFKSAAESIYHAWEHG